MDTQTTEPRSAAAIWNASARNEQAEAALRKIAAHSVTASRSPGATGRVLTAIAWEVEDEIRKLSQREIVTLSVNALAATKPRHGSLSFLSQVRAFNAQSQPDEITFEELDYLTRQTGFGFQAALFRAIVTAVSEDQGATYPSKLAEAYNEEAWSETGIPRERLGMAFGMEPGASKESVLAKIDQALRDTYSSGPVLNEDGTVKHPAKDMWAQDATLERLRLAGLDADSIFERANAAQPQTKDLKPFSAAGVTTEPEDAASTWNKNLRGRDLAAAAWNK